MVWIQQFKDKIEELKQRGLQLEILYVDKNQSSKNVRETMSRTTEFNLNSSLSFTTSQFFWLRLESMRRSKLRIGKTSSDDHVLAELSALLDMNDGDEGWVVIGKGSDMIIRLQGNQVIECLNKYDEWAENVETLGLVGAIRNFMEPPILHGPCNHSYMVSSSEEHAEGTVVCEMCKRPMKKYVVYE